MTVAFEILEDPFTLCARVTVNGTPVSPLSALFRCAGEPLLCWCDQLPVWLYAESNSPYSVSFAGGKLEGMILQEILRGDANCVGCQIRGIDLGFDTHTRARAAADLCASHRPQQPSPSPASLRFAARQAALLPALVDKVRSCLQSSADWQPDGLAQWSSLPGCSWAPCLREGPAGSTAVCVTEDCQPDDLPSPPSGASEYWAMYRIVPRTAYTFLGIRGTQRRLFVFEGPLHLLAGFALEWVTAVSCLPALGRLATDLEPALGQDFDTQARLNLLRGTLPMISVDVPSQMEAGCSHPIQLKKYPDVPIAVSFSNTSVLRLSGQTLHAVSAGSCTVTFSSGSAVLRRCQVNVVVICRVQSIRLSLPPSLQPTPGDSFSVQSTCLPAQAQNLSAAVWSVSPAGFLRSLGGGKFTALQPGRCTVTLTIEAVHASISVTVYACAAGLCLPSAISLRMNHPAQPVYYTIQPPGALPCPVSGRTTDASVAVYDPTLRALTPCAEGTTTLELTMQGKGGPVYASCPVQVLPEKDPITPPVLSAVCVLALFGMLVTLGTVLSPAMACAALGCFGYGFVHILQTRRTQIHDQSFYFRLIGSLLGALCCAGFACFGITLL